jgi:mRNA interferase HigB
LVWAPFSPSGDRGFLIHYDGSPDHTLLYRQSRTRPLAWYRIAAKADWKSLAEVRKTYPHADLVGDKTVFNIRDNEYRLITTIQYNMGKIFIREILTHAEYDVGTWKKR